MDAGILCYTRDSGIFIFWPNLQESYIHRIGRTGRARGEGIAITLVTPKDRMALRVIEKGIKTTIKKNTFDALSQTESVAPRERRTEKPKTERKERTNRNHSKGSRRQSSPKAGADRPSTSIRKKRRIQNPNRRGR